jgi:predicted RNA-binding protein with PUA-like domain
MKTEPQNFSISDLENEIKESTTWDGVRNYQARNFMRDEMKKGDLILFYHSSCKEVGIAGIAIVSKESHPDLSALDSQSKYFDPKATKDEPRWYMVDVKWKKTFKRIVTLAELKENPQLQEMKLLKKGNRLSIMPVTKIEFNIILDLV